MQKGTKVSKAIKQVFNPTLVGPSFVPFKRNAFEFRHLSSETGQNIKKGIGIKMNKYLAGIKHELSTAVFAIIVYYSVLIVGNILLTGSISVTIGINDAENTSFGYEIFTSTAIFLGIFGVLGFTEDFKFFMQNCFTRKEIFTTQTLFFVTLATLTTLINTTIVSISSGIQNFAFTSLLRSIYGEHLNLGAELLLSILILLCLSSLCYAITVLFHRFDKKKVALGFALYGVLVVGASITLIPILPVSLLTDIVTTLTALFGFVGEEVHVLNPILTFAACCVTNFGIAFLLLRRTELN